MNGLERIVSDAAARLERNGLLATGRLRLTALSEDEIRGLSGLLGTRWRPVLPGATASVDLAALDAAMRASPRFGAGLVDTCAAARGAPLRRPPGAAAAPDRRPRGGVGGAAITRRAGPPLRARRLARARSGRPAPPPVPATRSACCAAHSTCSPRCRPTRRRRSPASPPRTASVILTLWTATGRSTRRCAARSRCSTGETRARTRRRGAARALRPLGARLR